MCAQDSPDQHDHHNQHDHHHQNHHQNHAADHQHEAGHDHPASPAGGHSHGTGGDLTSGATDLSIADQDLSPSARSRRRFMQSVGLLGLGATTGALGMATSAAAQTAPTNDSGYQWLAGDHHIHTQYSSDGLYTVGQHVGNAKQYGIDWMVITDHGAVAHEKVSVGRTNADVLRARGDFPKMLVFQGLEWNIPGAEHGTIFVPPSVDEVFFLNMFEYTFDGALVRPDNPKENSEFMERKAQEGLRWLAEQVRTKRIGAALFLANHPSRRGVDSPHEIRGWSDAAPGIAVGMEGAPGHQAAGIAKSALGPEQARGFYDNTPTIDSFALYPLESYRTFGGFDWMTAKVGGLWDSLLAEGRRWWITANSDSHSVYKDTFVRGDGAGKYADPTSSFFGKYGDPVRVGSPVAGNGDYWSGFYSKTLVGATSRDYLSVMAAISAGRMWVMHGDLIKALDMRVAGSKTPNGGVTLGGNYVAKAGDDVVVTIKIGLADKANNNGDMPVMGRVDLISGDITGPTKDRDSFAAPAAVVKSFDIKQRSGEVTLSYTFSSVKTSFYVRIRGTDGRFSAPGTIEPRLDPVPIDPWTDLWFYANPIFVNVS